MRHFTFLITACLILGISVIAGAQKLLPAVYSFSMDKTAYVTLKDNSPVEGLIHSIDMAKGLVKSIEIRNNSGELVMYRADDISEMYLPGDFINKKFDYLRETSSWDNGHYKQSLIQAGYVVFEQVDVQMGRKHRSMLLQLLNPNYSSKIRVYNDPWAFEPATDLNRDKASYYVKDGEFPAAKLEKEGYTDQFIALFGECEAMWNKKTNAKWEDFGKFVYDYSRCK